MLEKKAFLNYYSAGSNNINVLFLKVKVPALVSLKVSISTLCGQLHLAVSIV